MPSKKRQRQRLNRLAGRPVRIVVCAYPHPTIEPTLDLLKSAVLYGDEVVLHSPIASMVTSVQALATTGPDPLLDLAIKNGGAQGVKLQRNIDRIDAEHGKGVGRRFVSELTNPNSVTRAAFGKEFQLTGLDADELDQRLAEVQEQLTAICDEQFAGAGVDKLQSAIDKGVLAIHPINLDDELDDYNAQLAGVLRSPGTYPVFDQNLGDLVADMIAAGAIEPGSITAARGTQAATAERLLAQLPTFPNATMDEIIDIRDDLQSPLVGFRAEMIAVTAQLDQLDEDFYEAANELWHSRVLPKLQELDELTHERGLLKTYGAEIASNLAVPAGTAFVVGLQAGMWSLANLGVLAALGVPAAKRAAATRKQTKTQLDTNPYYFLHSVDQKLT